MTQKLTLAITTFNRCDLTLASFAKVYDNKRIDEILIIDDGSDMEIFGALSRALDNMPKIRLYRQVQNRGMMQNKADAVAFARNNWVILFDSDNVCTPEYIDAIPKQLNPSIIYCPSFARPNFDMRALEGRFINRLNARLYSHDEEFHWMLNTCNYVVNQTEYGKRFKFDKSIRGTDTAFFAVKWLAADNSFFIMPGAHYDHLVHEGSEFMKHVDYNMASAKSLMQQIKNL